MNGPQAVDWMSKHGRLGYAAEINALQASMNEYIGEAGPNWQHCPELQRIVKSIRAEIAEVEQAALERYEDWASDPLP